MSCPVCHKVNTPETGVPFPSDSMRLLRYCKSLKISPKDANKDLLICFSHFESADQIKKGGKVVGVLRLAIPKRNSNNMRTNESNTAGMTLDQILAQDVGIDISHTPSTSRSESGSNSAALVDFNFLQRTSIGGQNNATPTPLTMMTNICRQNFLSVIAAQNSSQQQWMLLELTNKTLVLYRHKKSDSSPAFDQNYFKEWLITSFNLPPKAIIELSEVVQINNFCFVFVVLDEQKTAENILSMFRSASPNFYQCSLNSAKSVLVEGTLELLKQKRPTAFSFTEEPSLEQCFGQLLDSTSPSNGAEVPKIDENAWRNVADALLPAYRSLVSTPSPQQFNFNNLVTAAMGNSSSPNLNPFISSAFGIQQQPFDQSSSSHKG